MVNAQLTKIYELKQTFDTKHVDLPDQSSPISEPFEQYIDASTISCVDIQMKEAFGET